MASRDSMRTPGRLEVEFRSPTALLVAYTVNLSRGGMFLECQEDLPPKGAILELAIKLPDRGIVSITGVVAWHREEATETEARGIGVQFESLGNALGEVVDDMVREYSGVRILVVCADDRDQKALLRHLISIMSTAEVLFAVDEESARETLDQSIDLLLIDADQDQEVALSVLRYAVAEFGTPAICISQRDDLVKLLREHGASDVLGNPPNGAALRASVLQRISHPSKISPAPHP